MNERIIKENTDRGAVKAEIMASSTQRHIDVLTKVRDDIQAKIDVLVAQREALNKGEIV